MISYALIIEGYDVIIFQHGALLIDNLDEYKPNFIFLDIKMPKISGYDVLKAIRSISSVPIIILTGIMDTEAIYACIEMGADDYVKKPFYPHELVSGVVSKLHRVALQFAWNRIWIY